MGRMKVFFPVVVALVFAIGGAFIAYKWAQSQRPTAQESRADVTGDIVNVAVAALQMPWGTKLTNENIQMQPFLRKSLRSGYFADPSALVNRVLIAPLDEGDIINESRLAPVGVTSGGITAVITPGSRAIAVRGDKVVGLSGLIKPLDRVDVLVTVAAAAGRGKDDRITKVVLANVLVLAAGTQMHKDEKGEAPVDVYTLEVTPEEAERLALAANEGVLHFALRNTLDSEIVLTSGARVSDMLEAYQLPRPARTPQRRVESRGTPVEIIRGTARSNVNL